MFAFSSSFGLIGTGLSCGYGARCPVVLACDSLVNGRLLYGLMHAPKAPLLRLHTHTWGTPMLSFLHLTSSASFAMLAWSSMRGYCSCPLQEAAIDACQKPLACMGACVCLLSGRPVQLRLSRLCTHTVWYVGSHECRWPQLHAHPWPDTYVRTSASSPSYTPCLYGGGWLRFRLGCRHQHTCTTMYGPVGPVGPVGGEGIGPSRPMYVCQLFRRAAIAAATALAT